MNLLETLINNRLSKNIGLIGMTNELFCMCVDKTYKENSQNILIVTSSLYEANKLYVCLQKYNSSTLLFPMDDFLTSESIAISPDFKTARLDVLNELSNNKDETHIVITHLDSFLRFLPEQSVYV